jgi:two-component system sensor kinase FixL
LESEFDALLDAAVDAIVVIDDQSNIVEFNPAAERLFGYERRDVLGQTVDVLMPEPYHSQHEKYVNHYLETGEKRIMGIGREVVGLDKRGEAIPLWLSVGEAVLGDQRRFVGILRDLTGQHAAERERHALETRLARVGRFSLMGEMAAGIAHEINQPLTAISLFAQAGRRLVDSGNFERMGEVCTKLNEHALRASEVVERMQTMARQGENVKAVMDCNDLIDTAVQLAESEARIYDIQIEFDKGPGLAPVSVDGVQIQQVALNLLRNGMEAMVATEGDARSISIRTCMREDGQIEVSVSDKGCGVPDEHADKLFTPFSTTKSSGMGMGLSISQAIVRAHGGSIGFHNNDDGGSTFWFTLPAVKREHQHE